MTFFRMYYSNGHNIIKCGWGGPLTYLFHSIPGAYTGNPFLSWWMPQWFWKEPLSDACFKQTETCFCSSCVWACKHLKNFDGGMWYQHSWIYQGKTEVNNYAGKTLTFGIPFPRSPTLYFGFGFESLLFECVAPWVLL